ncbi:urea carboxylase [Subtercola boreus]|uniref:Urea carboxylase n=2 Tax=Subtercola boreus TaxID=120213 RepID=A0A3E0WBK6_9MICO|nr:urea amidolyase associated protein UAAP1 [Subtercola boreus]RFA20833.1 urea carboxylase [Subtercola boreus]RFA20948.1 urea carboxylase [Subtercola boreus]RFA27141.1 urea carboxylase [Subtercola boreus]
MPSIADDHLTDSVLAARADARAQALQTSDQMPYRPAATSPFVPDGVPAAALVWAETVAPGGYTHRIVSRGTRIRLDDPTGAACAHVILFNALETSERLNVADTIKIPWQAYLGSGHPLLSGDGRALATITADTSGRHDTFCGTTTDESSIAKYGSADPQGPAPSGRSRFLLAASKHGLTGRDLPPSISFFKAVHVEPDGALTFQGGAGPGTHVELVAEIPLLVLIVNVPHPLDPADDYLVGPLRVHAWPGTPTLPGDPQFTATPEVNRAYLNSIDYAEARGL